MTNSSVKGLSRDGNSIRNRFIEAAQTFGSLIRPKGKPVRLFSHPDIPYFSAMEPVDQERVIQALEAGNQVMMEMNAEGKSIRNNRALLWRLLSMLDFVPLSDAFDKMEEADLFEVYNSKHQLAFASPWYFDDVTSYSLEDLYCRSWQALWIRDEGVAEILTENVMKAIDPSCTKSIVPDIKPFRVTELYSDEKRCGITRPKLFTPVTDPDGNRGFICVHDFQGLVP